MIDPQWTSWVTQTAHPYSDQKAERAELARLMRRSKHYAIAMRLFSHGVSEEVVRELLNKALIDALHGERFALIYCPIPPEYSLGVDSAAPTSRTDRPPSSQNLTSQ